jgi:peptide/nickel transport system ATP-binding protein
VVGESGSGKTTLTRMLLGFQPPTAGRIRYNGQPLDELDPATRALFRRDVQAIFQDPFEAFNPFYKVEHPLVTPLRRLGIASSRRVALDQVEEAMTAVGLRPLEPIG